MQQNQEIIEICNDIVTNNQNIAKELCLFPRNVLYSYIDREANRAIKIDKSDTITDILYTIQQ